VDAYITGRPDRQRGATARVAVELGQHDAGEADALGERVGGGHRVLADHRVDDEQDLVGLHRIADARCLRHHLGVHAEASGGVDDHHVVLPLPGERDGVARHGHRVTRRGGQCAGDALLDARVRGEHRHAGPLADHLELGDRVRPLQVRRDEHGGVAAFAQVQAELPGERRLASALKAREQDDRRRVLREPQRPLLTAEDGDQLLVHDLDDLLRRVQCARHLSRQGALPHGPGELADHGHRDVGVQQGTPDLTDRRVDVRLGQPTPGPEVLEGRRQAIGQRGEHSDLTMWCGQGSGCGRS
jgi:hypothetical protein